MNRGVVLLVIGIVAIVMGGWIYTQGSGGHMMGESGHMMDGHHQMDAKPLAEVIMPELSGTAADGHGIFIENCSACHGENAGGNEGAGPPLIHIFYEPGHHGDDAIYRAVEFGVRKHHWTFGDMPPVEGVSREQVTKIIDFIRTVQRANGID